MRTVQRIDVQLELELSTMEGSPSQPITLTATAYNRGDRAIVYWPPSCIGPRMGFKLLGPGGEPLELLDPCAPQPLCDIGYTVLKPGESVRVPIEFAGSVYRLVWGTDPRCLLEPASSGEYVMTARFVYAANSSAPVQTLEKQATFRWSDR